MINKTRCLFYEVNGQFYKDLEEAQKADLLAIIPNEHGLTINGMADWLLANAEAVATILTTTPKSRNRKPRKDKGLPRKPRSPNTETPATP